MTVALRPWALGRPHQECWQIQCIPQALLQNDQMLELGVSRTVAAATSFRGQRPCRNSAIIGVAITRGDFKAALDKPVDGGYRLAGTQVWIQVVAAADQGRQGIRLARYRFRWSAPDRLPVHGADRDLHGLGHRRGYPVRHRTRGAPDARGTIRLVQRFHALRLACASNDRGSLSNDPDSDPHAGG